MASARVARFGKTALLAAGSLLAAAALAEIALRVFAPIPMSEEVDYLPDAHVGMRLAPARSYALQDGGRCSVNAQGFRGERETSARKSPGVTRVVALGGSSTFCYRSDDRETWCALLESMLRARYGHDVEVVNAGVPGYGAFESKINYVYRIRHLHPDLVLVYHTWNDLKYFKAIEAGQWPAKTPWWPTWRRHLRAAARRSQIARRARLFLNEVVYPQRRENRYAATDPATAIAPDGPARAWARTNYADLAVLLEADSVAAVFATQASLVADSTIDDPAIRKVLYVEYADMSFDEVLAEWDATSDMIREVAAERGICLADVRPRVPSDTSHFHDHVHLTRRGNEAVARAMFDGMIACEDVDRVLRGIRP